MTADLPPRLTTSEVCALGRFSIRTFQRRRRTGKFLVKPCDRGAELMFPRDEVLRALGMITDAQPQEAPPEPPRVSPDKIREARSRLGGVRGRPPASRRDAPGAVRGAGQAPALRLVTGEAPSD